MVTRDVSRAGRVLLVDDNAAGAQTMAMLLEMSGFEVGIAGDGALALEMCFSEVPDVLILDIGLPDMTGNDVARRIREVMTDSAPVIIGVSGWEEDLLPMQESPADFDFFLTKPVNYDELEHVVRQSLDERRREAGEGYEREGGARERFQPR